MGNEKRPENPAYNEAKKYKGKGEKDRGFVAFMSGFWRKTGLNYKTIIGSSFAWCALFIVAMNSEVGQKYVASAGARHHATYGVEIDYRKDGIPKGAVVHINHGSKCVAMKDGSNKVGNHVGFADGDCPVSKFMSAGQIKKGSMIPIYGGNQADMVKRSYYPIEDICEVRWPTEIPKPQPVTAAVDCGSGSNSGESTR